MPPLDRIQAASATSSASAALPRGLEIPDLLRLGKRTRELQHALVTDFKHPGVSRINSQRSAQLRKRRFLDIARQIDASRTRIGMALTGHIIEEHSTIGRNPIRIDNLSFGFKQIGAAAQTVFQTERIFSEPTLHRLLPIRLDAQYSVRTAVCTG